MTSINKDADHYEICTFMETKKKLLLYEVYFAVNNLMTANEALQSKRTSAVIPSGELRT